MSVTPAIAAEVAALNTTIAAAQPLAGASQLTVTTLALQAAQLVVDTQSALLVNAGALDTGISDVMAPAIVADFQAIVTSAGTQLSLADLRGLAGRVASNLTNG
jgi:hypothetical protein